MNNNVLCNDKSDRDFLSVTGSFSGIFAKHSSVWWRQDWSRLGNLFIKVILSGEVGLGTLPSDLSSNTLHWYFRILYSCYENNVFIEQPSTE